MTFDPTRRLVMASFKTVLGHGLAAGTVLTLANDPAKAGEVDEDTARLLWNRKLAVYEDDHRPTPVETPEQEAARLARQNAAQVEEAQSLGVEAPAPALPDDLNVTKNRLLEIAAEEGVAVESDDNKADLQAKIITARAAKVTD